MSQIVWVYVCVYKLFDCYCLYGVSFTKGSCVGLRRCVWGCMSKELPRVVCWMVCMNVASVCASVSMCRNCMTDAA